MSSRCRASVLALMLAAAALPAAARELKVCSEPNNLPFSNRAGAGFENRIAALVAHELGATLVPVSIAQHGPGFLRATLGSGRCDVLMALPVGAGGATLTRPYYRASWVFVGRADRPLPRSFDDPALRDLAIGVPVVGEGADTPPVIALGRRGIVDRLVRYPVGGDLSDDDDAAARMIEDVAEGRLDVAVMWGPAAGYHAARHGTALHLLPTPPDDGATIPLALSIAMAVKRDNPLHAELDAALTRRRADIAAVLAAYHVPVLPD